MLQISVPNGILDLPPDVELSIDEVNVLWSDETSYSLPCKVSYTDKNKALLGHPERWENATQEVNLPCMVTHTGLCKKGIISFITIDNEEKTLELSMLLDEGAWFEWAKKTKLSNACLWPDPVTVHYDTTGDLAHQITMKKWALEGYTHKAWDSCSDPNWFDEQILSVEFTDCAFCAGIKDSDRGKIEYDIINKYGLWHGPATPLLFIRTVIKYLFKDWVVKDNPYLTGDLARAFIFNENIIYFENGSVIDYAKLVPDIEVEKFIELIENLSGTKLLIDPINRIVRFASYKQVLTSNSRVLRTPLTVNMNDVEIQRFVLTTNVADCDYSRTHKHCNEELMQSNRVVKVKSTSYQLKVVRDAGDTVAPSSAIPNYTDKQFAQLISSFAGKENFKEQLIFDMATQCFGIEKWVIKDDNKCSFNRELLSHRFYPATYGKGENDDEKEVSSVAMNGFFTFLNYFVDALTREIAKENRQSAVHMPFYACQVESSNEKLHDYEKVAFGSSNASKVVVSIQRGMHRVNWQNDKDAYLNNQDHPRDLFSDSCPMWLDGYVHNDDYYYKWASSDIYNSYGEVCNRFGDYENTRNGRMAPTNKLISFRATGEYGLLENFYKEYAKFTANKVPAEVPCNCQELNATPLHDKVKINGQEFVITRRKLSLTLHHYQTSATELAAVVL